VSAILLMTVFTGAQTTAVKALTPILMMLHNTDFQRKRVGATNVLTGVG